MQGGPTLHDEDAILFAKGILERAHVYALREGEVVRNIDDTLMVLEQEIVKIKEQSRAWTCMFYDDEQKACRIYEHRPAECRALKCWDLRGFEDVMARPGLQRRDLIKPDDGILKIIEAHEHRCSYEALESAIKELRGPDSDKAVEKILGLPDEYELATVLVIGVPVSMPKEKEEPRGGDRPDFSWLHINRFGSAATP